MDSVLLNAILSKSHFFKPHYTITTDMLFSSHPKVPIGILTIRNGLIGGMFFLSLSSNSQSVTINTESAPVEYYRMPDDPLPAAYTTYSADIDVSFSELSKTGFTKTNLIDTYLNLAGYKRVNKNEDVEITANIGEFIVWSEMRNTHRTKTKDKEGVEHTKYTYNLEVKYSQPMSVEVFNREGKTLLDEYIFSNSNTRSWTSSSYSSMSELDNYWRYARSTKLADLQKDLTREGMDKISDMINDNFGYRIIKDKAKFGTIGKKKHPEYEIFQRNADILVKAFELMRADKSLDQVREKASPALAFYHDQAAKYKTGNKDQKKLKHLCLFNQALAYFWLEDFDQAETLANSILKFDTKDKVVKRLLEDIEYTRASLVRADRTSRHQVVVGEKT